MDPSRGITAHISQVNEEVTRLVLSLKGAILGEDGLEPSTDVITQVANEVYAQDLFSLTITNLHHFEFEVSGGQD